MVTDDNWKEIDIKNHNYGCLDDKININDGDFDTVVLDYI